MSDKLKIAAHLPETVTISRQVYDVLIAQHHAYTQICDAMATMGTTPRVTPGQAHELRK